MTRLKTGHLPCWYCCGEDITTPSLTSRSNIRIWCHSNVCVVIVQFVFDHRRWVGLCDLDVPLLFVTQVSVERSVCPVHTWQMLTGDDCTQPGVFSCRLLFTGPRKLIILRSTNIVRMRLYVVWTYGTRANELGLFNGLRGLSRWIAAALYLCWLYPVSWYRLMCTSVFM